MYLPLIMLTLLIALLTYAFTFHTIWSVHKKMVKDCTDSYGRAGYKKFIQEFEKVEWKIDPYCKESLVSDSYMDKFHADIIMFNGKGMMINNPFSYFKVKRYVNQYIKKKFGIGNTVKEWR